MSEARRSHRRLVLVLGLLAMGARTSSAVAQAPGMRVFRGMAIDARTTAPIQDGQFSLTVGRDTLGVTHSDSTGRFQLTLRDSGRAVLHARRIGYRQDSIRVNLADAAVLRIALVPVSATSLPSVVISDSALTGFERRARRNAGGKFIRLADIERLKPVHTADLLRSVPGITIADSAGSALIFSARNLRQTMPNNRRITVAGETVTLPGTSGERCPVRVAVDGRLTDRGFSVNDIRPADIEAIEFYVGAATIPVEFSTVQASAPCGLVMIWTRRRAK